MTDPPSSAPAASVTNTLLINKLFELDGFCLVVVVVVWIFLFDFIYLFCCVELTLALPPSVHVSCCLLPNDMAACK